MRGRFGVGVGLVLLTSAPAIARDVQEQIVIQCRCLDKYSQWLCEVFWFALC